MKSTNHPINKSLYEAITLIKTAEEAENFFSDLCTPAELQAITDRWEVATLVEQKISYRDIYQRTGVSVTTVGRVAHSMMFGKGGYKLIYQRFRKKNKEK